ARRRDLPFIITPFAHFGAGENARVARNATMDHQRRLLQQAHAVLALTNVERQGFARWNIRPQRLVVVGGGVDDPPPLSPSAAAATAARFGRPTPFALFIGRANYDKGAIRAARATLRLAAQGAPLTLVLAGRVATDFEKFIAGLDAEELARVRLLGPIEESE